MIRFVKRSFSLLVRIVNPLLLTAPRFSLTKTPDVPKQFKDQALKFYQDNLQIFQNVTSVDQFQKKIQQIGASPFLIYCTASWCQPCKIFLPKLTKVLNTIPGSKGLLVDVDAIPDIASALKITSVPTVLLTSQGKVLDRIVGIPQQKVLQGFLKRLISLMQINNQSGERALIGQLEQIQNLISLKKFNQALQAIKKIQSQKDKKKQCQYMLVGFKVICFVSLKDIPLFLNQIQNAKVNFAEFLKQDQNFKTMVELGQKKYSQYIQLARGSARVKEAKLKHVDVTSHQGLISVLREQGLLEDFKAQVLKYCRSGKGRREFLLEQLKSSGQGLWWNNFKKQLQRLMY